MSKEEKPAFTQESWDKMQEEIAKSSETQEISELKARIEELENMYNGMLVAAANKTEEKQIIWEQFQHSQKELHDITVERDKLKKENIFINNLFNQLEEECGDLKEKFGNLIKEVEKNIVEYSKLYKAHQDFEVGLTSKAVCETLTWILSLLKPKE